MALSLFSLLKHISKSKVFSWKKGMNISSEKLKTTEIYSMEACFDILDLTSTEALAAENHWGNVTYLKLWWQCFKREDWRWQAKSLGTSQLCENAVSENSETA